MTHEASTVDKITAAAAAPKRPAPRHVQGEDRHRHRVGGATAGGDDGNGLDRGGRFRTDAKGRMDDGDVAAGLGKDTGASARW